MNATADRHSTRPPLAVLRDGAAVTLAFGPKQGWGNEELCALNVALREALGDGGGSASIDMAGVTHLPSGLYGLLADLADAGVAVRLVGPSPRVRGMLWFRHFAAPLGDGAFRLTDERQEDFTPEGA